MKLLSVFRVSLITTFYCVSVISSVNCDAQTSQNESQRPIADPKGSALNTSREPVGETRINDIVKLLQLLEKNFDQLTARNEQVSGLATLDVSDDGLANKLAMSSNHVADSKQNVLQRLFRRSTDNTSADSSKSNQTAVNESTSGPTKTNSDNSQERNVKTDNQFLANLFKNGFLGNIEAGSPLQPVKQILGFVMDKLKLKLKADGDKDDQQLNHRFPRKLFERGKNVLNTVKENAEGLAPVGIHRTLKLGPWSVNFDMGKP